MSMEGEDKIKISKKEPSAEAEQKEEQKEQIQE